MRKSEIVSRDRGDGGYRSVQDVQKARVALWLASMKDAEPEPTYPKENRMDVDDKCGLNPTRGDSASSISTPTADTEMNPVPTARQLEKLLLSAGSGSDSDRYVDFDPDRSNRETRKLARKIYTDTKRGSKPPVYTASGVNIATGRDTCDCMDTFCQGCHFPCPKCRSQKCGYECRQNRKFYYEPGMQRASLLPSSSDSD